MRALTPSRHARRYINSISLGNNEVLAREGIDTSNILFSFSLSPSNNEVLAREGIDTQISPVLTKKAVIS